MNKEEIQDKMKRIHEQAYKIEIQILDGGMLPVKAHQSDAGFDLFATDDIEICVGQVIKHPLNFKMKLPPGTYAEIKSKSGLGSKGMLVFAGVIDEGYRGIPHVVATNVNSYDQEYYQGRMGLMNRRRTIKISKGQKMAQMIVYPFAAAYYVVEVDSIVEDTDRGAGGFGSSGK